jgi:putative colanic acid biosynthesis acetyltransferase WcaF
MTEDPSLLELAKYQHGFSLGHRLARAVWRIVEATLFRWSPPALQGWRRFLLRAFGARLHSTSLVYPTAKIWAPWNLSMKAGACISWGVDCYCVDKISLGENALVSQHVRLIAASHDIRDPAFPLIYAPIEIENGAWICSYAFVGMGVHVREGAVVAATATAVQDVPAWTVVGGNPARQIGNRSLRTTEKP